MTPVLAFAFSYLGCLLGLVATARARRTATRSIRTRWLVLGAWAIGGTGIWVMHFVAMIGFTVNGTDVNYDIPITIASWLIAVLVVGAGLFIVGFSRPSALRIIAAGLFTGVGVAAMHYSGVSAVRMDASVSYDTTLVALSFAIAIVAAIVALWFTVTVRRARWITIAAAIMAVAVTAMHYTGMAAMHVRRTMTMKALSGVSALDFVPAILIFVLLVCVILAYALLIEPASDSRQRDAVAGTPNAAAPNLAAPNLAARNAATRNPAAANAAAGKAAAGNAGRAGADDRRDHVIFPVQRPTMNPSEPGTHRLNDNPPAWRGR
ncbi:MHYT domain-containing protein [Rugosimonospora africana]|uniref:MHYT domain-containing protein n=1 Tax=Rugosimonospora africana TaxID=556532 RepID=UPI001944EB91|nr:MHYT domain-containing protein [Rugosimonospora africana]